MELKLWKIKVFIATIYFITWDLNITGKKINPLSTLTIHYQEEKLKYAAQK